MYWLYTAPGLPVAEQASLDEVDDEDDEVVEVCEEVGSPSGSPVGSGSGFDHGPVHPGGRIARGVIPPWMPMIAGGQPLMMPPLRTEKMLPELHEFWDPGGSVTTAGGAPVDLGTGTVEDQVGGYVNGAVKVIVEASGVGEM